MDRSVRDGGVPEKSASLTASAVCYVIQASMSRLNAEQTTISLILQVRTTMVVDQAGLATVEKQKIDSEMIGLMIGMMIGMMMMMMI